MANIVLPFLFCPLLFISAHSILVHLLYVHITSLVQRSECAVSAISRTLTSTTAESQRQSNSVHVQCMEVNYNQTRFGTLRSTRMGRRDVTEISMGITISDGQPNVKSKWSSIWINGAAHST